MDFRLTRESMALLIEEIIDTVEEFDDRDEQAAAVKVVLEANGIIEIPDDEE